MQSCCRIILKAFTPSSSKSNSKLRAVLQWKRKRVKTRKERASPRSREPPAVATTKSLRSRCKWY